MNTLPFVIVLVIIVFSIACKTPKNISYFENIPRDTTITSSNTAPEYIIHSNDLLYISVTAMDENMVKLLNLPNMTNSTSLMSGNNSLVLK